MTRDEVIEAIAQRHVTFKGLTPELQYYRDALDFCRDLIEQLDAPTWHDRPTGPGFWLWSPDMGIIHAEPADFRPDAEPWDAGPYYGPIPPDPKNEPSQKIGELHDSPD